MDRTREGLSHGVWPTCMRHLNVTMLVDECWESGKTGLNFSGTNFPLVTTNFPLVTTNSMQDSTLQQLFHRIIST